MRGSRRLWRTWKPSARLPRRSGTPRPGRTWRRWRPGGRWPGPWHEGKAWLYGRWRLVRWKEVVCLWRVAGPHSKVKAVVAEVEGYTKRFTIVSSARDLTGLQLLEIFCARFRQEDGFRDLKQRLGWEECRAWTKQPVLRTSWAQMAALSLLRLLQLQLEQRGQDDWWLRPPWNKRKTRPSILDLERLLRSQRENLCRSLREWLQVQEKEKEKTGGG